MLEQVRMNQRGNGSSYVFIAINPNTGRSIAIYLSAIRRKRKQPGDPEKACQHQQSTRSRLSNVMTPKGHKTSRSPVRSQIKYRQRSRTKEKWEEVRAETCSWSHDPKKRSGKARPSKRRGDPRRWTGRHNKRCSPRSMNGSRKPHRCYIGRARTRKSR